MLETRHLALVDAVAEVGTLTRAGDRLHLTQSALSHQLLDIESRLGVRLFHRVGRRMVLTEAGHHLLACARRVLPELARAEEELRHLGSGRGGTLRLTVECHTAYHWLPPIVKDFTSRHPGVTVNLEASAASRPTEAVLDGSVDLALVSFAPADARLRADRLFDDEIVALVGTDHALASARSVTPERLAGETLLSYVAFEQSTAYVSVFAPAGIRPAHTMRVQLTEAMVEMARGGLGIAILPRWSVAPHLAAGCVVGLRIGRRGVLRRWHALTLRSAATPPWLRDFVGLLRSMPAAARDVGAATARRRPEKREARAPSR